MHSGKKTKTNLIDIIKMSKEYKNSHLELSHRIDKKTTGCILLSKNKTFLTRFNKLIKKQKIKKKYIALVKGKINKTEIKLNQKILNKYNNKIKAKKNITITKIKLIKKCENFSLIQLAPITGRMHQIRIHLAHIGNPIANDTKYGSILFNKYIKKKGLKKMFLHSRCIKFKCPIEKKKYNIKAEYNKDIKKFLTSKLWK